LAPGFSQAPGALRRRLTRLRRPCCGTDIEALIADFFMAEFHETHPETWQKNDITSNAR
jgi:hypothetical protein